MMKITTSNFKNDKNHGRAKPAVHRLLKQQSFVAPADVFIEMGHLTKADYAAWHFGRVPYRERVINCNLSKASRILRAPSEMR